jgi:hypothetical protein
MDERMGGLNRQGSSGHFLSFAPVVACVQTAGTFVGLDRDVPLAAFALCHFPEVSLSLMVFRKGNEMVGLPELTSALSSCSTSFSHCSSRDVAIKRRWMTHPA